MLPPHLTQELADEFAVGSLDPESERSVALHIVACDGCSALVAEAERVAAAVALAGPLHRAPDNLRARVLASARPPRFRALRRSMSIGRAGTGIAAALLAVAALTGMLSIRGQVHDLKNDNAALKGQVDDALATRAQLAGVADRLAEAERASKAQNEQSRQDRELLFAMLSPKSDVAEVYSTDDSGSAIGRLIWNPDQKRVWFVADRLPARPSSETYQLWVSDGGHYESLGTFNPDSDGFARYEASVPDGMTGYDAAVVTVEQSPGAGHRSGPSVFAADLSRFRH